MLTLCLNLLLAYLLGSVCGSLVLGRLRGVDIRAEGSGNAGGTNALRSQGFRFALLVILIDVGKGIIAAGPLPLLQLAGPSALALPYVKLGCGLMAVIGHMFPIYFGFRGGKGAGTWAGTLVAWSWPVLAGVLLVWVLVVIITGYVGLGTMLAAAASLPLAIWLEAATAGDAMFIYCVAAPLVVILAHQSNIRKMFAGTENRFQRVRIQNWWRASGNE